MSQVRSLSSVRGRESAARSAWPSRRRATAWRWRRAMPQNCSRIATRSGAAPAAPRVPTPPTPATKSRCARCSSRSPRNWARPRWWSTTRPARTRAAPTEVAPQQWVEDFHTNVVGAVVCAQLAAPAMRAQGHGTILFTGGGFAHEPSAPYASLSADKAALRSLTYSLAQELGGHGIHVATVTVYGLLQVGTHFDPQRIAAHLCAAASPGAGEVRDRGDI